MLTVMVLLNLVLAAQAAPDATAATWGSAVAAPGQRAHGYLPIPGGTEDVPPLPVTVIRGAKPGHGGHRPHRQRAVLPATHRALRPG